MQIEARRIIDKITIRQLFRINIFSCYIPTPAPSKVFYVLLPPPPPCFPSILLEAVAVNAEFIEVAKAMRLLSGSISSESREVEREAKNVVREREEKKKMKQPITGPQPLFVQLAIFFFFFCVIIFYFLFFCQLL